MNQNKNILPILAAMITAGLFGLTATARAQIVYDLATDFNTTPGTDVATNIWAYGTFTTDPGTPSTFNVPSTINFNTSAVPGVDIWFFPPVGNGDPSDPNVEKNVTGSDTNPFGIDWRAGKVSFGPFHGPAVAQFTAPTTGLYNISAAFQTDQVNVLPTAYVYIGNTNVFTQTLADPGNAQFGTIASFAQNYVTLSAGETVDFVVGAGLSTTQVDATLTLVPEPSTWAMMLAGLALLGFCVRRKGALLK
jgi:hypothetical protein